MLLLVGVFGVGVLLVDLAGLAGVAEACCEIVTETLPSCSASSLTCGANVVAIVYLSFLNLNPISREKFFIPIKKIEDFNELLERYEYNTKTGRFDLKEI